MFEKILERRLRKLITVNNMQFGFSPGKGTIDAVFIIQQLQEKHLEVLNDLFLTFVDLEKSTLQGAQVCEKERSPREASEASRSNTPWSINSSETHAWQN